MSKGRRQKHLCLHSLLNRNFAKQSCLLFFFFSAFFFNFKKYCQKLASGCWKTINNFKICWYIFVEVQPICSWINFRKSHKMWRPLRWYFKTGKKLFIRAATFNPPPGKKGLRLNQKIFEKNISRQSDIIKSILSFVVLGLFNIFKFFSFFELVLRGYLSYLMMIIKSTKKFQR